MTEREVAIEAIRLCKQSLVESMPKSSALAALLELRPRLSDGRFLNKNVLEGVMAESRSAAEQTVAEPFGQLEQALAAGSDPEPALRRLLDKLG